MSETYHQMKKYYLSLLASCFLTSLIFAQQDELRVGLKAGVNLANISGDNIDGDFLFAHHIGGFAEIPITEKLAFVPEFLFSAQGFKSSFSSASVDFDFGDVGIDVPSNEDVSIEVGGDLEQSLRLNYFSFPLLMRFNVTDVLHFEAGPQIGLLSTAKSRSSGGVSGNINGEDLGGFFNEDDLEDFQEGSLNVRDRFNHLDLGFSFGAGAHFTDNVGMSVRYYLGLTDISNTPELGNIRNNVIMASLFYRF